MIKIDVITGFLGAGKTTFIKQILESGCLADEKIIIIENEFGEIPIDNRILENRFYDLIEISGGCLCCSLKGNVIEALADIALNEKPDRVLIEPSGIFMVKDMYTILQDPDVKGCYRLNGIYTMVDGKHFMIDRMRQAPFFISQLIYGSHMILSKVEDMEAEFLDGLIGRLREYNVYAQIHAVSVSEMDKAYLKEILSLGYEQKRLDSGLLATERHDTHKGLTSLGIRNLRDFSHETFKRFITHLSKGSYGEIIRMKGYVYMDNIRYLVNYVSGDLSLERTSEGPCLMTVIGHDLDTAGLRRRMTRVKGITLGAYINESLDKSVKS